MRRLAIAFLAVMALVGLASPSWGADKTPKALVYDGRGAAEGAAEDLASILAEVGYEIKYFFDPGLLPSLLPGADLLAIGGTDDDILPLRARFTPEVVEAMRQFVDQGGAYLGICGGAYLAAEHWAEGGETFEGFGLAPVRARILVDRSAPRILCVAWLGRVRGMYYQAGPCFDPPAAAGEGGDVLAYYGLGDQGERAAVQYARGKGTVLLIGPHPEATVYWLDEDGLSTDSGDCPWVPTRDLLRQAVEGL